MRKVRVFVEEMVGHNSLTSQYDSRTLLAGTEQYMPFLLFNCTWSLSVKIDSMIYLSIISPSPWITTYHNVSYTFLFMRSCGPAFLSLSLKSGLAEPVLKSFKSCLRHCKKVRTACRIGGCVANNLFQDIFDVSVLYNRWKICDMPKEAFVGPADVSTIFQAFRKFVNVGFLEHTGISKEIFAV